MNGRTLDTSKVGITTATVEIRVLTVSGKQMTLSVFRQLPKLDACLWRAHDLREAAEPWGTVNYCPDCPPAMKAANGQLIKDHMNPSHLHLVWQSGTSLYRSAILEPQLVPMAFDPARMGSYVWLADRLHEWSGNTSDVWWDTDDLAEALARYGELLRLPQLFIAV